MKFNLTAKVLFTTLALCSAVVSPAIAQMYPGTGYPAPTPGAYPAPTPGAYPAPTPSAYPAPTPSAYPAPTSSAYPAPTSSAYPGTGYPTYPLAAQKLTAFICDRVGIYPATFVQVNGRILPSPLLVFQTASDNLTPQQRCNDVSGRMTRTVAENGGKLSNLLLTTGKVNRQAVICFVNTAETCNPSNVVLTLLRRENAQNPGKVLARIVRFGRDGGGIATLEAGGIEGGEEEIIPQAVSLEQAVNELASESSSLESGGIDPYYNQAPANAPTPSASEGSSI